MRSTLDLDFTAEQGFPDKAEVMATLLNTALKLAERQFQIKARCLSIHRKPKNPERTRPTYAVNVCFQISGDRHYQDFEHRKTLPFVDLEISLNDMLCETFNAKLGASTKPIRACALKDILAKKLRALLQQPIRNRSWPQDVSDISSRMSEVGNKVDLEKVAVFFVRTANSRDISPRKSSFDGVVRQLAKVNYDVEIRSQATLFIPFDEAWAEVTSLVSRLNIFD